MTGIVVTPAAEWRQVRMTSGWRTAAPAQRELHLWLCPLEPSPVGIDALHELLDETERARAAALKFARDQSVFVAGRAILRCLLASYACCNPREIQYNIGAHGKLELAHGSLAGRLSFNQSNTKRWALIGLMAGEPLGVDIEATREMADAGDMVERMFAPEERQCWNMLPVGRREDAFFASWTRKEAFIKATGRGLGVPLDSFAVSMAPDGPAQVLSVDGDRCEAAAWTLATGKILSDHWMAAAARAPIDRVLARRIAL